MRDYIRRLEEARNLYDSLLESNVFKFSELTPSMLPVAAGVYVIWLKDTEEALYVGRTVNLRRRLYQGHLMGNRATARLKKYLIDDLNYPDIKNYPEAKEFIKARCNFQFVLEEDSSRRGHIEGLLGYLADARYIENEH